MHSTLRALLSASLLLFLFACQEQQPVFESLDAYPVYPYRDLGAAYSPEQTTFKLWSPAAQAARVKLYDTDAPEAKPTNVLDMTNENGAWTATGEGNLDGSYYTYQIKQHGQWRQEATDPYARAAGTNGLRGQVVDLASTNPEGWENDKRPAYTRPTDVVLYELHVRDASIAENSGIEHKGKFLGLTERGTKTPQGIATGLDHLVEMGVTHVHLLPSFDFMSVDESRLDEPQFNWGYDPQNYNVPEGSYSTDPSDGKARIREFKAMVQALHDAGIRVIMDVVYNHTGRSEDSHFQHLIPDYFYRFAADGSMSNASACGNEIASDRPMVRKYIRQSVEYWVKEYHVDGFRFDLMGIHDIATMNEISESLHAIDSTILIYGEGWKAGDSPVADSLLALKANVPNLKRIAAFSDDIRDGMKGSVFVHDEKGFVSGAEGKAASVQFGVVGATKHPQIDYAAVNYSDAPWAPEPTQCINYASCHDNHTLHDRLAISNPTDSDAERAKMHRMALAIVLTSQGIPFLHAGSEFRRTKGGEENSYKSPDAVNAIRWERKAREQTTVDYVRDLIALRKAHPAFRLGTTDLISKHLTFLDVGGDSQLVAYRIIDAPGDDWNDVVVMMNGKKNRSLMQLPADKKWRPVTNDRKVDPAGVNRRVPTVSGQVIVPGRTLMVLVGE